jgi:3-methylcrotonyl-CoA carboxylase alpha subunit
MKMEHTICAPGDGKVHEIYFSVGDMVDEGLELLNFTPAEPTL